MRPGSGGGSEHAWGNHWCALGGAVNGGQVHGTFPGPVLGGPDDGAAQAHGRHVPTIATDQVGASVMQWLGLAPCIVGVSRYDTLERPRTGGLLDPDADAIQVLHPDLLITSNWGSAEEAEQLAADTTRLLRLDGFNSMAEVEENLRLIGNAMAIKDIEQRVTQLHQQWREAARRIDTGGQQKR